MDPDVLIALISSMSILGVAIIGAYAGRTKIQKVRLEKELNFQKDALSFQIEMKGWDQISQELKKLIWATCIDRFIIFNAWNGNEDPRWTTAIFQYRQGDQQPVSYIHVELDVDYVKRLKSTKIDGEHQFTTKDSKDSLIKSIYKSENITAAAWFHIKSKSLPGSESVSMAYCSFATHVDEVDEIDGSTLVHCRRIVDMIRGSIV